MRPFQRSLLHIFMSKLLPGKVLILEGARRTGKTVFLQQVMAALKEKVLLLNGEDFAALAMLRERSIENYKRLIGDHRVLIIDEAQKIPEIGSILKLMIDEIKGLKIVATGSSMFDLANKTGEPLTGRKITFRMFPLAQMEFAKQETLLKTKANLEERMVFGSYPELQQYKTRAEKTDYLRELVNSYLLKDILQFENIRNSDKLHDLLKLIAYQLGKEVSLEELGRQLGISKNSVEKYLDLLSKVFVIYKVRGYNRNLRKEITKMSKWYFYDNGIRNTLIANLNPLSMRNDVGELWENYALSERLKFQSYTGMLVNNYFWRTYHQQEIDWVEERKGKLFAYELKWKHSGKAKAPSAWKEGYPRSKFETISQANYLDWIM
ncbi:MAG: ATP-binding protein [Bacteroidetes bacterium]|nr:ATP-binding protein [Bacteroidota bacterium]